MGHCYNQAGRMICDRCAKPGASTRRCPSGYCVGPDLCPTCLGAVKSSGEWAKWHQDCAAKHAEFEAQEARKAAALAGGAWLRCSALGYPDGRVRVLFRNQAGETRGYAMDAATYRADIAADAIVTPEYFAALGSIEPAPGSFDDYYQGEPCAAGQLEDRAELGTVASKEVAVMPASWAPAVAHANRASRQVAQLDLIGGAS